MFLSSRLATNEVSFDVDLMLVLSYSSFFVSFFLDFLIFRFAFISIEYFILRFISFHLFQVTPKIFIISNVWISFFFSSRLSFSFHL